MNQNNNLGKQFLQKDEDAEGQYRDFRIHKENRKSSNDRKEKKKIRKFSKYDY